MKQHAFTLIELLIVVAIIGILSSIAVPNFLNAQVRAKVARSYADMRTTSTAIEHLRLDRECCWWISGMMIRIGAASGSVMSSEAWVTNRKPPAVKSMCWRP